MADEPNAPAPAPGGAPAAAPAEPAHPASGSAFWFQEVDSEGNFKPTWKDKLPDHLREEKSIADFKNPTQMAEAFVNTKAMVGKVANSTILPQTMEKASAEDLGKLRKLVGAPDDPAGYEIKRPEGMGDKQWSDEQATAFAGLLSKHNAPKALAGELMAFEASRQQAASEAIVQEQEAWIKGETAKLRQLWGANYEERREDAIRVAKVAGNFDENHPINRDPTILKDYANLAKHFKADTLREATAKMGGTQSNAQKANAAMTDPTHPLNASYMGKNGEEAQMKAAAQIQEWLQEPEKY